MEGSNKNLDNDISEYHRSKETILFLRVEPTEEQFRYSVQLSFLSEKNEEQQTEKICSNISDSFLEQFENLHVNDDFSSVEEILEIEKKVGFTIYQTFFPQESEIRRVFEKFLHLLSNHKIHQLTLVISSPDARIANIPFVMMYSDLQSDYPLSLVNTNFIILHSAETNLQNFQNTSVAALAPPLRVLFVTALPEDLEESGKYIDIEKEQENFIHALENLPSEGKVLIEFLEIGSLDEIENILSEGQHHIIHISGHGGHREGDSGILLLEDEYGNAVEVTGEELAKRLSKFSDLRLIFLSACETARAEEFGVAGALINHGMPAVLGMRYSVSDSIATIFTSNFYKYLCRGNPLSKAIFQARKAIWDYEKYEKANQPSSDNDVSNMSEWYLPFLFLNQRIGALVDYSRQNTDTRYFFRKPKSILIGGKKIGQGFVGRRKQIIQLTHFTKEHRIVCIHGQGGVGKTTLAIRFAENFERGKRKIIQ